MTATGLLIGHAKQNSPWPTESCELAQAFLIDTPPDCGAGWVKLDPTHTCRLHASSLERSHFIPNPNTSTAEALAGLVLAGIVSTSGLFRDFLQGVPESHLREDTTPAGLLPSHGRLKKKNRRSPITHSSLSNSRRKPRRPGCLKASSFVDVSAGNASNLASPKRLDAQAHTGNAAVSHEYGMLRGGKGPCRIRPSMVLCLQPVVLKEWCQDHWSVARIRPLDEITAALPCLSKVLALLLAMYCLQPLVLEGCT